MLRKRLDEAASMFARGDITASQLRVMNSELLPALEALEARMTASTGAGALTPFLTGVEGVRDVWARLGIEQRRAVLTALADVTFLRTDRKSGRVFDPETVKVSWKAAA
jgi:hypothetical protein